MAEAKETAEWTSSKSKETTTELARRSAEGVHKEHDDQHSLISASNPFFFILTRDDVTLSSFHKDYENARKSKANEVTSPDMRSIFKVKEIVEILKIRCIN
ncbi:hypothetical protein KIN20_013079 [Parelaphostrongylus tenuis]|uniref:Uncharacterized protein n=1 Tax=Parelaphostrongylus tenuis TaxID=148309 RepID=A0AAD5MVM5_PARTN|nr:hypothetical protein KIN20_013079 [Parelaphostrongylus tenuis]